MKKIRIAQIGFNTNSHSVPIAKSLKKQSDIFEIAGYVLPENERERIPAAVAFLAEYPELTLQQVLDDPTIEAVAVETDEIYLLKYAQLAAEHGKHIHMEKPGSPDLAAFEKLINTMKKSGKVFHMGYMYRYNPFVQELMQKVKSGELGDIYSVEAQMNCIHAPEAREWLKAFPGGMMFFLGCHLVDLILQIHGTPNKILPLNKCSGRDGAAGEDFGMAVFEYSNGVSFAKTSAVEIGGFARRQLVVSGTNGTVEIKPFETLLEGVDEITTTRTEYTQHDWKNCGVSDITPPFDRYDDMMAAFAAMVRGERENPYTYDYELQLFKTLLTCCGM